MPYESHPEYKNLPEDVQRYITPEEHAWMLQWGRDRLIEDLCYPEREDD